jgi:dTDP-4-amino-4,6-dideoxygalactose transaminase
VGAPERQALLRAFDSNWIAPLGPEVDAFEADLARYVGRAHAVALSSGTAGLHLALQLLGVQAGDDVAVPTLTFIATAAAATYLGARPVFIDASASSWNLDPDLLEEELEERARTGRRLAAVIAVDLYGQCADYRRIASACERFGVPLVEDSAEALGATYDGLRAGRFGEAAVFSFNGNKIITTSGGGMLVTDNEHLARGARHLATQARQPVAHYEHHEVGYNYRLSNLLAAVGRAQLEGLDRRVNRRRLVNERYRVGLKGLDGIEFMPRDPVGEPTWWLTCITVDSGRFGVTKDDIRAALEMADVESRPTWKPMHLQRAFAGCPIRGGGVAERIFRTGLCLPSGSNITDESLTRIIDIITSARDTPSRLSELAAT